MFTNESEAHERVLNAVEDIGHCCEVKDDYGQWSDIAASSIQSFLEDLDADQLDETCEAFMDYADDCADKNLSEGIKDSLRLCLEEMLEFFDESLETETETDDGDEDEFADQSSELVSVMRENLKKLNGGNENE